MKLNSKQLRVSEPTEEDIKKIKRNPIYLILDNVWDTYNIGSLFRLADAIAAQKLYICGESEFPPNSRIHKAAVGTESWTPWEKRDDALSVIDELKAKGVQIISVEQDLRSIPYSELSPKVTLPVALVIGHETNGVSQEVLIASDLIVELPMFGINKSLNVWGTGAAIAYKILESL
jgi:23S rRNA (guanosine2251-2'-O)-methyltransferase